MFSTNENKKAINISQLLYFKLLEKLRSEKQVEEQLKNTPEGQTLIVEKSWNKAFKKTAGVKIKDDPKLLKKSIKREERAKKEKWRCETTDN